MKYGVSEDNLFNIFDNSFSQLVFHKVEFSMHLHCNLVSRDVVGRLVVDELGAVLLVDGEIGHVDAVLPQAPRVLAVNVRHSTAIVGQ